MTLPPPPPFFAFHCLFRTFPPPPVMEFQNFVQTGKTMSCRMALKWTHAWSVFNVWTTLSHTGLDFEWCCVEKGAGLKDPWGSLPAQDILRFYRDLLHPALLVLIPIPFSHFTHDVFSFSSPASSLSSQRNSLTNSFSLAFRWSSFSYWGPAQWHIELWKSVLTINPVVQIKKICHCLQLLLPVNVIWHHSELYMP